MNGTGIRIGVTKWQRIKNERKDNANEEYENRKLALIVLLCHFFALIPTPIPFFVALVRSLLLISFALTLSFRQLFFKLILSPLPISLLSFVTPCHYSLLSFVPISFVLIHTPLPFFFYRIRYLLSNFIAINRTPLTFCFALILNSLSLFMTLIRTLLRNRLLLIGPSFHFLCSRSKNEEWKMSTRDSKYEWNWSKMTAKKSG